MKIGTVLCHVNPLHRFCKMYYIIDLINDIDGPPIYAMCSQELDIYHNRHFNEYHNENCHQFVIVDDLEAEMAREDYFTNVVLFINDERVQL